MNRFEVSMIYPKKSKPFVVFVTGDFDMNEVVKVAFDVDATVFKYKGLYERLYRDRSGREYLVKDKNSLNVSLSSLDIINMVEHMCKNDLDLRKNVGPGGLEFLLFDAIRDIKGVDFFKKEAEQMKEENNA